MKYATHYELFKFQVAYQHKSLMLHQLVFRDYNMSDSSLIWNVQIMTQIWPKQVPSSMQQIWVPDATLLGSHATLLGPRNGSRIPQQFWDPYATVLGSIDATLLGSKMQRFWVPMQRFWDPVQQIWDPLGHYNKTVIFRYLRLYDELEFSLFTVILKFILSYNCNDLVLEVRVLF